jgi:acyl carrier protein
VLADAADGPALLDTLGDASNVLYAPDLSSTDFDSEAGYRLFSSARRLSAALATMASPPRLFMLTRNAMSESDRANPAHAVLWGLGRTLALEHPDIWGGIINLDDSVPAEADSNGHTEDGATMPAGEIKDVWRSCEPEQRRALLRDHVGVLVAAVMGLPSSQSLNPSADFFELGMDSLMSVILQRALAETLGEVLPQSAVFDYPTVEALADSLAAIGDADQQSVDAYEDLTEADLSERVS